MVSWRAGRRLALAPCLRSCLTILCCCLAVPAGAEDRDPVTQLGASFSPPSPQQAPSTSLHTPGLLPESQGQSAQLLLEDKQTIIYFL